MDLAEIARVMRRRWLVLLPGVLLTLALAAALYLLTPTKYQSQATVELLNSQKATVPFNGNPFLSTQTSLTGMADSLARNVNSDTSLAELKALGMTGTSEAKIADNAQAPLLWLTITGTGQQSVLKSDQILVDYTGRKLQQFQSDQQVPPAAMIRMTVIVPPQQPAAQLKTKIEYVVLLGLGGLALSLVATFYVEARRRPRSTASPAGAGSTVGAEPAEALGSAGPAAAAPAREAGGVGELPDASRVEEAHQRAGSAEPTGPAGSVGASHRRRGRKVAEADTATASAESTTAPASTEASQGGGPGGALAEEAGAAGRAEDPDGAPARSDQADQAGRSEEGDGDWVGDAMDTPTVRIPAAKPPKQRASSWFS
ncbi:Wzz/FepE/Etk N-terminal domain-containing protein [Streptacidiphilus neutrinimicus]|uniref:Wzz/FepE/Etk N-terminal domain-containing protein n=1 Tax=Streptacidiphilus neutrinimicus TaxID=105420 RepID=UPI0007C7308B|nr:Wzz/FepE/Etk N-terminal domain-containing protein [Streptacidiphilus neutrinimicus]